MHSSAASPLFSCALIAAFSPSSTSSCFTLSRPPTFGSLGRQTDPTLSHPPRLPTGSVVAQRTPSWSLTQSLAMPPKGVVMTVPCWLHAAKTAHSSGLGQALHDDLVKLASPFHGTP